MNRKTLSLLWTIIIYSLFIGICFRIVVEVKAKGDEFVTLGFEKVEGKVEAGAVSRGGGTEEVFSSLGDVPVEIKKTKKSLSPLDKPPYKGGRLYNAKEGEKKFTLSGELSKRKLLHFLRPEYPVGVSENTIVKLRIRAKPDGTIATIEIVKTGGLAFDRNAIQAVREWRFQPLSPNVEQEIQSGIVTIYFQLR